MFLGVEGINTFIGKAHILHDVSLSISKGEIVALLGRNGVGKSTTLKSIMGLLSPETGSIRFKDRETVGLRAYKTSRLGIGYVPEDRSIFPALTVRQNLLVGMKQNGKIDNAWTIDRVYSYFPRLKTMDRHVGGKLSGGEQQMLAIGRTLMGNPELLLLDEPTEGLAPIIVQGLVETLHEIHEEGCSILLVEHSIDVALSLASRAYVMNKGQVVFEGASQELRANEEIQNRYLRI